MVKKFGKKILQKKLVILKKIVERRSYSENSKKFYQICSKPLFVIFRRDFKRCNK